MSDLIINSNVRDASIVVLGAPYDKTSSFGKGADAAPRAIKEVLDEQIERYERYTSTNPSRNTGIAYTELRNLRGLSPDKMVAKLKKEFGRLYRDKPFVITLGGEHSITNGPLEAIAEVTDPREVTVVQIDAHFDLRPDDSDYNDKPWGKYAHSAVMRRAVELGYNLIPVGVRAYHGKLELGFAEKQGIRFFEWGRSNDPSIEEIVKAIPTPDVYLTVDVDGFDPSVMPSTGTPVPDGLSWRYGVNLLKEVFRSRNVIAADIVEVIPGPSPDTTTYNAAQLLYCMMALREWSID